MSHYWEGCLKWEMVLLRTVYHRLGIPCIKFATFELAYNTFAHTCIPDLPMVLE